MISLRCPSTIMRRSAADGNHMPRGLASPSQSLLSRGRAEEDERGWQESRDAKQERKRGGEGEGEGRSAEAG